MALPHDDASLPASASSLSDLNTSLEIDFSDSNHDSASSPLSSPRDSGAGHAAKLAELEAKLAAMTHQAEQQNKRQASEIASLKLEKDDLFKQASGGTLTADKATEDLKGQVAALQKKCSESLEKKELLEAEVLFHKKRYDHAIEKVSKEKDYEIQKLKGTFQEWAGKRKKDFITLQQKLKAAITQTQKFQQGNTELTKQNATLKTKLEEMERELAQLRSEKEKLTSDLRDKDSNMQQLQQKFEDVTITMNNEDEEAKEWKDERGDRSEWARRNAMGGGPPEGTFNVSITPLQQPTTGKAVNVQCDADSFTIQWYRSFRGSLFLAIQGTFGSEASYVPTVDDIGAVLRVECTAPSGAKASAEIGPVACRPKIVSVLTDYLKKMDVVFAVTNQCADGEKPKNMSILLNKEKVKLRNEGRTFAKAPYNKGLKVDLDGSNPFRFSIKVSDVENKKYDFQCRNSLERDVLALTTRLFNILQMMGKGKPVDATVALLDWIRHTNTSDEFGMLDAKSLRDLHLHKAVGGSAFQSPTPTTQNGTAEKPKRLSISGKGFPAISGLKPAGRPRGDSTGSAVGELVGFGVPAGPEKTGSQSSLSTSARQRSESGLSTTGGGGTGSSTSSSIISTGGTAADHNIIPLDLFGDLTVPSPAPAPAPAPTYTHPTPPMTNNFLSTLTARPPADDQRENSTSRSARSGGSGGLDRSQGAASTGGLGGFDDDDNDDKSDDDGDSAPTSSSASSSASASASSMPSTASTSASTTAAPASPTLSSTSLASVFRSKIKAAAAIGKKKEGSAPTSPDKGAGARKVDAEGYIIEEEKRGFSDFKADGFDSGSDKDEEEPVKPKINIKIDMDKPKVASGEELRAVALGSVALAPPGSGRGVSSSRGKPKTAKKKKEKDPSKKPKKTKSKNEPDSGKPDGDDTDVGSPPEAVDGSFVNSQDGDGHDFSSGHDGDGAGGLL